MPRTARIVVADTPHHVVQRGHNKQPVFFDADDFEAYLATLRTSTTEFGVKVYAYCLMTNHVHLILDPGPDVHALAEAMKRVSGKHTRRINRLLDRSGTLWESRFKSSPIQSDGYLLACCRYTDLNPVRARMVRHPGDYRWSSYRQKTSQDALAWIDADPCYLALGATTEARIQGYARFVLDTVPSEDEINFIRRSLDSGQLTGDDRFIDHVERVTGTRVERREPGRPLRERGNQERAGGRSRRRGK